jgi:hypothetical protein
MDKGNIFALHMSVFLIVALLSATPTTAQTIVSDTITTTTWTKALSPYRVTGTAIVPSNNILTIEPGVDVLFDADVQFIVQGRLYAVGTQSDSIRFFKGTASNWRGIRISGGDSSTIAYMRINDGNARGITEQDSSGGALYISGTRTRVVVSNSIISGNTAQHAYGNGGGGAIYNCSNAVLTMTNCTISNNSAGPNWGYGGGIYNCDSAILTMTNCTLSNNSAINGGGLLNGRGYDASTRMIMISCTICDNKASYYGGGVANRYCTLTMTKCTISGNSAGVGGGVLNDFSAELTMTNCTISGNSASSGGFVYNANSAKLTITNSIIWEDSASTEPEISRQSGVITLRYSDVQGGIPSGVTDGGGNINADPLFVNAGNDDYQLQAGSPCINTGDPDLSLDPDGTRADMGAYYYGGVLPVELSSFSASPTQLGILLKWRTETETNNYGFDIERRAIGESLVQWNKIDFFAGSGSSNSPHEYSFSDHTLSPGRYAYRLKQIDNDGSFKYSRTVEIVFETPKVFSLEQNYPNPFNPSTVISYSLPVTGLVSLKIYDVIGREVATLVNEAKNAGSYQVTFNAGRLASGVYFYNLQSGNYTSIKKLVLMK